jgi:uncharacterized protein
MAAPDIYLDACCFIYLVEGTPTWRTAIENRLRAVDSTARLVTSQLSRLECRTRPMRDRDEALLRRYDTLFSADRVSVVEIGEAIIDRATGLRARYGYKTPDAIHLATGIESCVTAFLTGDVRLQTCLEVRVEVIARA